MASSTSSYCDGSNRLVRIARQWYAHAAGLLLLWTRLGAPWAALAGWLGGARYGLPAQLELVAVCLAVPPLAVAFYAGGYMLVQQGPPVPLKRLKGLDTLLLSLAMTGGVLVARFLVPAPEQLWLVLPAAGLFAPAWVLNWWHEATLETPGQGALPPAPTFMQPVAGPVTAGYRSYDRSHTGVDIGVGVGTPIFAPAAGEVLHAGPLEQWGYAVLVDHGNGWSSFFAHLERPALRRGARVMAGSVLGWSGTSGISTGPHVHVELRYRGQAVDPLPMLKGAGG